MKWFTPGATGKRIFDLHLGHTVIDGSSAVLDVGFAVELPVAVDWGFGAAVLRVGLGGPVAGRLGDAAFAGAAGLDAAVLDGAVLVGCRFSTR
ncbi:hypothetical protein [Crateriforma spongiae]|uniref:hypothetical protein n=1 Tax=Crateriforma spongiae TaxID=2724528 RepID=UPI001446C84C|nr:hypothetical protein [Crateriforma spongiae]